MRLSIFLIAGALFASGISDSERKQLLDHLNQSQALFNRTLTGLSAAQLKFKPAPDRWSVLECAEHLTLAESWLFDAVHEAAQKDVEAKSKASDVNVLEGWGTRTQKVKAPPILQPNGRWPDAASVKKEFARRRAVTIHFAETTQVDLRDRTCCGGLDLYQQLLGISAHVQRHVDQMKEVMADPNFPKS